MKAFELPEMFIQLECLLQDPDSDPQQIEAIRAMLVQEGPAAIDNTIYLIKDIEGQMDAISKRIKELQERKKRKEDSITRLREMMISIVDQCFDGKVKTAEFRATCFDSHKVDIDAPDLTIVPDAFVRKGKDELDKAKVKDALKDGMTVNGVSVVERTERSIRIS